MSEAFAPRVRNLDPPQGKLDMAFDIMYRNCEEPYATTLVDSSDISRTIQVAQAVHYMLYRLNYIANRIAAIGGTL